MNNIYETMWKDHKSWVENSVIYYESLLKSYHPELNEEYDIIANKCGTFQFMLDKINQDERMHREMIIDYNLRK